MPNNPSGYDITGQPRFGYGEDERDINGNRTPGAQILYEQRTNQALGSDDSPDVVTKRFPPLFKLIAIMCVAWCVLGHLFSEIATIKFVLVIGGIGFLMCLVIFWRLMLLAGVVMIGFWWIHRHIQIPQVAEKPAVMESQPKHKRFPLYR
jgi:hypothetical protein